MTKFKRVLLYMGGFSAYVGAPLAYIGLRYDLLTSTSAGTSISAFAVVGVVAALPVLRYFFKSVPFRPNWMGIILIAMGVVGKILGDFLLWVGVWATAGGVVGDFAFRKAEKMKVVGTNNDLAQAVMEKIKENSNV